MHLKEEGVVCEVPPARAVDATAVQCRSASGSAGGACAMAVRAQAVQAGRT